MKNIRRLSVAVRPVCPSVRSVPSKFHLSVHSKSLKFNMSVRRTDGQSDCPLPPLNLSIPKKWFENEAFKFHTCFNEKYTFLMTYCVELTLANFKVAIQTLSRRFNPLFTANYMLWPCFPANNLSANGQSHASNYSFCKNLITVLNTGSCERK